MTDVMYLLQSRPGYIPAQGEWVTSSRAYYSLSEAKEDAILCAKKSNTEYRVAMFRFDGIEEDCPNCSGTGNIHNRSDALSGTFSTGTGNRGESYESLEK